MGREHPAGYQPRFPRGDLLVRPHADRYQRQRVCPCARPPQHHTLPLQRDGRPNKLRRWRCRRRRMEHRVPSARHGHQPVLRLSDGQLDRRGRRWHRRVIRVLEREHDVVVWFYAGQCGLGCVCVVDFVSERARLSESFFFADRFGRSTSSNSSKTSGAHKTLANGYLVMAVILVSLSFVS